MLVRRLVPLATCVLATNVMPHTNTTLSIHIYNYRNPVAAHRPGFREVLLSLLGSPEEVLSIPPESLDTHPLAGVLGSPLEAGENMYSDLQNQYCIDHDYQELN